MRLLNGKNGNKGICYILNVYTICVYFNSLRVHFIQKGQTGRKAGAQSRESKVFVNYGCLAAYPASDADILKINVGSNA